jgi:putative phosphoribosyl transferase
MSNMTLAYPISEPTGRHDVVADERVIAADEALLKATLNLPLGARGLVVLLHASSAERFGVQSRFASEVFGQAGLATLQVDLLTPAEEATVSSRQRQPQDLSLLLARVLAVVDWLQSQRETLGLSIGLFASRSETIAALMAAERVPRIAAVASRGGCPDHAPDAIGELRAPTLLLIGREEQARAAELAAEFFARHLWS